MAVKVVSQISAQAGGSSSTQLITPDTDPFLTDVTATSSDLNILTGAYKNGVTRDDIVKLGDIDASADEINHLVGITEDLTTTFGTFITNDPASDGSILYSVSGAYAETDLSTLLAGYSLSDFSAPSSDIDMDGNGIINLSDPTLAGDAVNLQTLETTVADYLPLTGGTLTGDLSINTWLTTDESLGRLTLGEVYSGDNFEISGEDASIGMASYSTAPLFQMFRMNGSISSPTKVLSGENFGSIYWLGHDGVSNRTASIIDVRADDDWDVATSGAVTTFRQRVNGTLETIMTFDNDGNVVIDNDIIVTGNIQGGGLSTITADLDMQTFNIINVGNVDGRDVSVDGAKLDGIEVGATADQDAADVPYTPAGDIAATNVQDAIDELDNEKLSLTGGTLSGDLDLGSNNLVITGTVGGRDISVDGAKLDSIEVGATADQDAADVPYTPTGGIAANNVQDALSELDTEKLSLSGGTMTDDLNMGSNAITNSSGVYAGNVSITSDGLLADNGGNAPRISSSSTANASAPTYSFDEYPDTGIYLDSGVKVSVAGSDELIVNDTEIDVLSKPIKNVSNPVDDGDAVNLGFVDNFPRVLSHTTDVDLTVTGNTSLYTVPISKSHVITQIIVISKSYNPVDLTQNALISIGIGPPFNDIVNQYELDWGLSGAADQALYVPFNTGAGVPTPNSSDVVTLTVNTASDQTALEADVILIGFSI